MNPKLLKERMRTKAQRPDIVVAYGNASRAATSARPPAGIHPQKTSETRRSA